MNFLPKLCLTQLRENILKNHNLRLSFCFLSLNSHLSSFLTQWHDPKWTFPVRNLNYNLQLDAICAWNTLLSILLCNNADLFTFRTWCKVCTSERMLREKILPKEWWLMRSVILLLLLLHLSYIVLSLFLRVCSTLFFFLNRYLRICKEMLNNNQTVTITFLYNFKTCSTNSNSSSH